ncbi:MAG: glutamate--cysteine ligase [Gammaproteobacteria bacterium]|jgi:glutamate--cysteine ligase|nr:glutamate--cysteine ligase [Gammaproteobacteria bacterium]MBT4607856.1 glutamate--cysteine ligase [Thiotrichales bacterium]MBT3471247.1 glutamate--cysteine ligase [Gammaproteobacteria bacterium]MBT3966300.1 glutamate--cysteine ligase [Gammaproteobacteria bacterium]MBT4079795.1 glutamate--cysteine ligase [Gammaproteobacteria bacterium]
MQTTVPHLTTALTGPLLEIETHLLAQQPQIETWFRSEWQKTPAPFYTSVDLRNAGFKLAPVDTNLFPAGFNNINPAFFPLSVQAIQNAIERICPTACNVLIIPENHTRNLFYLESLATLQRILQHAGFDTRIGSLMDGLGEKQEIELPSGGSITLEPALRQEEQLQLKNGDGSRFNPCVILMNNDLSDGIPEILKNLDQNIIPPLELGWGHRRKSDHFQHYSKIAQEFAEQLQIDPWLIDPMFEKCGEIDFKNREGEECLATHVEHLLSEIQKKYDQYNVDRPPFVLVKADAGTYGMGIMTIHNASEVHELNRKQRNKMAKSKGGQGVSDVIIQEGVYTFETLGKDEAVAEPVVYMMDHHVIGGFYRVHTARGPNENLNAPGMHFEPLAFANPLNLPDQSRDPDAEPNRFYAYGVIARLAMLAAAREIHEVIGERNIGEPDNG